MSRSAIMGNTELQLRAQVAALEQLLEIHERTTIEQSEKLEEALRASAAHAKQVEWSEQRARLLVETAVDAIVTMDEGGAIVQANPATERIFGYAPEELAGQPMTMLIPERFRAAHRAGMERYLETRERRIPWSGIELMGLHRSGREIPLDVSFAEFSRDGRRFFTGTMRDISERKRTEAALLESEEQFRTLANSIPQLAWMADETGYIFWYNQRWYEYTGTVPEDMEGWGWQSVHDPAELPTVIERWTGSLQSGEPFDMVFPLRGADGVFRPFLTRVVPVRDKGGRITRWFGTNTDVTEQREAEARQHFLGEASALLAASLDYEITLKRLTRLAVPTLADWCAIDVVAEDGSIQRVEVAHPDPDKVALAHELERRYPPDPDAPSGVPHVLRTGEPELVPEIPDELLEVATQDAEHLRIIRELGLHSYLVVPLIARGRTLGAITLVYAESDRRYGAADLEFARELARRAAIAVDNARLFRDAEAARRQTARILESIADAFFALDREWRITYLNREAERLFGKPAPELLGRGLWDEFPDAIGSRFWEEYHRALRENTPVRFEEFAPRWDTWFEYHVYPSEVGLSVYFRDVTERKRADAERERLIAALERSNQELDQFAYVASHDLKAPLRGIANLSEWIEEDLGDVPPEVREQLELLRGRVYRMEGLIDGILEFSRAGRVREAPEAVEIGALLEEIIDLLSPPDSTSIIVEPEMPALVTERLPLQQVFMNLLGNAIKYTRRPDARIQVGMRNRDRFHEFSVADNGPGIAPEFQERIWGIFQTLEARDKVEGTGIGLSLVQKIVESRGGRVWVESEEGAGATFRFTWPK